MREETKVEKKKLTQVKEDLKSCISESSSTSLNDAGEVDDVDVTSAIDEYKRELQAFMENGNMNGDDNIADNNNVTRPS